MACERYREALTDLAAGGPAAAELEAHLETCVACREELALSRRSLEAMDVELRQVAVAEPSPELAVRIRMAAAEADAGTWHPAFALRALAAGALVALLAFVLLRGRAPAPTSVATVSSRPRQSEATPKSTSLAPGVPAAPRATLSSRPTQAVRRPSESARPWVPPEPEVLVPPGQLESLQHFAALVTRGRVESPSLAAVEQGSPELVPPRLIDVRSVEITPLEIVPSDAAEDSGT